MSIFHSLAYLDFSTGTVIVQAVVGAVAGVALFGRRLITSIKQKLGLIKHDEDDDIVVKQPVIDEAASKSTDKPKTKKANRK